MKNGIRNFAALSLAVALATTAAFGASSASSKHPSSPESKILKKPSLGSLQILTRVLLPLIKPALTTVAIFSFLEHWNDFIGPLMYLNTPSRFTIAQRAAG